MSRTKQFLQNSCASIVQEIIVLGAGLVTPRIMLSYYGSEINGLIASLTQFFSYFNLVEAGLSGAAVYALYKPLASHDNVGINAIMSAVKKFYDKSGYIFFGLTVLLAVVYPMFVRTAQLSILECVFLTLILGFNGCIDFFSLGKYRAILTADQRVRIISYANSIHLVMNTIIVFALAYVGANIVVLKAVASLSIVLRSFILVFYCRTFYGYLDYNAEPNYATLDKRWSAFYLQLLGVIQNATPIILITIFIGNLKIASVYSIYAIVISGVSGVLGVFISGLSSSFGDVIVKGESEVLKRAYLQFELVYYLILTVVCGVSFVMIQPFVDVYTRGITDMNYHQVMVGFLFVLNLLLYSLKTPQGMLVISAGHYKETCWQSSFQAAIIVIVGTVLTFYYGIYGILIGLILSNIYRDIDLLFYIPHNVTHTKVWNSVRHILSLSISVLTIYYGGFYVKDLLFPDINSWLLWILCAVTELLLATVVAMFVGFVLNKKEFMAIIGRVKCLANN